MLTVSVRLAMTWPKTKAKPSLNAEEVHSGIGNELPPPGFSNSAPMTKMASRIIARKAMYAIRALGYAT